MNENKQNPINDNTEEEGEKSQQERLDMLREFWERKVKPRWEQEAKGKKEGKK